jgi:hypothetical protein
LRGSEFERELFEAFVDRTDRDFGMEEFTSTLQQMTTFYHQSLTRC